MQVVGYAVNETSGWRLTIELSYTEMSVALGNYAGSIRLFHLDEWWDTWKPFKPEGAMKIFLEQVSLYNMKIKRLERGYSVPLFVKESEWKVSLDGLLVGAGTPSPEE